MKRDYLVRAAAKKSEAVKIADRFVAGYRPLFGIAPPRGEQKVEAVSIAEDEQSPQAAE
ncbi:hypothetical protein Q1M63_03590 (plasmid) [Sinorhizobium meliloti]|nr:hypothetical protein Q1M63_03590 [Sinorhizobium meliloti]